MIVCYSTIDTDCIGESGVILSLGGSAVVVLAGLLIAALLG